MKNNISKFMAHTHKKTTSSNILSIYYSSSSRLYKQLLVSITSLSLTQDSILHIYLLDCYLNELSSNDSLLTKEQISHLENILKQKNKDSKIFYYDVSDLVREKFWSKSKVTDWNGLYKNKIPLLFIRYLLPYLNISTPNNKMLWLDTDTIIMQDLKELFETNLDNYDIGAIVDVGAYQPKFANMFHKNYFKAITYISNHSLKKEKVFHQWSAKCEIKQFSNIFTQNGVMLLNLNNYSKNFIKICEEYTYYSNLKWGDMIANCNVLSIKPLHLKYNCSALKLTDITIFHCCALLVYKDFYHYILHKIIYKSWTTIFCKTNIQEKFAWKNFKNDNLFLLKKIKNKFIRQLCVKVESEFMKYEK